MQGATVDLPPDSSAPGPAEGGHCRLMRENITQALLRASKKDCNDSRNRFVPRGALIDIIDAERVERILQDSLGRRVEDMAFLQEMAHLISPGPGRCICCFEYCTGRRMILSTVLLCGREDLLLSRLFLKGSRICDNDLPLSFDSLDGIDDDLSASEKELIIHMQWQVYTPFLTKLKPDKIHTPETFPEEASLPWIEKARIGERIPGEVSYIEQIEISARNHDLVSYIFCLSIWKMSDFDRTQGNENIFAVKTFEPRLAPGLSRAKFKQEVEANLDAPKHDRIVRLLTAFSYRERFYLLFPFADGGSLEQLWRSYIPSGVVQGSTQATIADWYSDEWLVSECLGISEALMTTHGVDGRPEETNGLLHSDIKPANILCFLDLSLGKPCIVLKLADFGEAQRLKPNVALKASRVAHVKTYRPPEHSPDNDIMLNYDVWCLGCLFLDFVTWAIFGQDGIDTFSINREDEPDDPEISEHPGQIIEDTFFKRVRKTPESSLWKRISMGYKKRLKVESGQATTRYSLWVASNVEIATCLKDEVISVSEPLVNLLVFSSVLLISYLSASI